MPMQLWCNYFFVRIISLMKQFFLLVSKLYFSQLKWTLHIAWDNRSMKLHLQRIGAWVLTLALLIFTLSEVSFSDLPWNDYWGLLELSLHFWENDTFDFYTFKNHTLETVWASAQCSRSPYQALILTQIFFVYFGQMIQSIYLIFSQKMFENNYLNIEWNKLMFYQPNLDF